jgi:low affinity Fe/Cu permease
VGRSLVERPFFAPVLKGLKMNKYFTQFAGWSAWAAGHPLAFILATAACLVWAVTGPVFDYSDTWQLVINTGTTVLTFLMVFVLQHSQNRDAVAIQAKLDELILHTSDARNDLIEAEKLTEKEVELLREHRAQARAGRA